MSRSQVTENKGKDASRSDNVVYVHPAQMFTVHPALRCECHACTQARLRLEVGGLAYAMITRQSLPISPNTSVDVVPPIAYEDGVRIDPITMQPNQTPADAILRDDEK